MDTPISSHPRHSVFLGIQLKQIINQVSEETIFAHLLVLAVPFRLIHREPPSMISLLSVLRCCQDVGLASLRLVSRTKLLAEIMRPFALGLASKLWPSCAHPSALEASGTRMT